MKKVLLVVFSLLAITVFGQKTKKPKTKKILKNVEIIEDKPIYEVNRDMKTSSDGMGKGDVVMEVSSSDYSSRTIQGFEIIQNFDDQTKLVTSNNKIGLVKNNELILPNIFDRDYYNNNNVNFIHLNINSLHGVYNAKTEKWVLPLIYSGVSKLTDEFYAVSKGRNYAIFNSNGEMIEDFKFNSAYSVNQGNYIQVSINDKYGIYSLLDRKLVIPCVYNRLENYAPCGNYFIAELNGKSNLLDINNVPKFKTWYSKFVSVNYEIGNFVVENNGKYGIINCNEDIILPLEYKNINTNIYNDGSMIAENFAGKFGGVNLQGKITLPFEYDVMQNNDSYDNKKVFSKGDKCGLIQFGQGAPFEIATCTFDAIKPYKFFFIAKKNNKYQLLNNYNKPLIDLDFDSIEPLSGNDYDQNLMLLGKIKNDFYLINKNGAQINKSPYKAFSVISQIKPDENYYNEKSENIFYAIQNQDNTKEILDNIGNGVKIDLDFDSVLYSNSKNIVFSKTEKLGVYSLTNKKLLVEPIYETIVPTKNGYLAGLNGKYFNIDYYTFKATPLN